MENSESHRKRNILFLLIGVLVIIAAIVSIILLVTKKDSPPVKTPIVTLKTPAVSAELVASGLKSPTAVAATKDTSDKQLYVVEREGTVRSITPGSKAAPKTFLDIKEKVKASGEMGLLGLAFHPNYKENGYFFVNYIDKDQNTVIARYKSSSEASANPASEKILFTLQQPYTNHNGGDLAFGRDSYLYAAIGDGGSAGDPQNRAQDKSNYFGKILRIDIDTGDPYTVPDTNPFADQAGTKPEIWSYGLRNPWRMSFDKKNGDLYIADVGQGELEEVNVQKASSKGGENYGWRCFEGNQSYNPAGCQDANAYVKPVVEYNHDEERCSITGGYVYRGSKYPALDGKYFYGDFCNGQLFYTSEKDGKWSQTLAARTPYAISAFGQDSNGELYITDFNSGDIYRLQDTAN